MQQKWTCYFMLYAWSQGVFPVQRTPCGFTWRLLVCVNKRVLAI